VKRLLLWLGVVVLALFAFALPVLEQAHLRTRLRAEQDAARGGLPLRRAQAFERLRTLGPIAGPALVELYADEKDEKQRARMAAVIGRMGAPVARPVVEYLLREEAAGTAPTAPRQQFESLLARVEGPAVDRRLRELVHGSDEDRSRVAAIVTYRLHATRGRHERMRAVRRAVPSHVPVPGLAGKIGDVMPVLLDVVGDMIRSHDRQVRQEAGNMLAQLGAAARPALAEALDDPRSADAAAVVLARRGGSDTAVLAGALTSHDPDVRVIAAEQLYRQFDNISRTTAYGPAKVPDDTLRAVVRQLSDALDSTDERVRRYAMRALCRIRPDSGQTPIIVGAIDHEDQSVRLQAIETVGARGIATPEATEALCRELGSKDDRTRYAAMDALPKLGESTIAPLDDVLETGSSRARHAAAAALGIHGEDGVRALMGRLESGDEEVARLAAHGIARAGKNGAIARGSLVDALADPRLTVRREAARTLVVVGPPPSAVESLIALHAEREVRLPAVQALAQLGSAAAPAVSTLAASLTRPVEDPAVRLESARTLGLIGTGGVEVEAALAAAVEGDDAGLRWEAARSLVEVAGPRLDAIVAACATDDAKAALARARADSTRAVYVSHGAGAKTGRIVQLDWFGRVLGTVALPSYASSMAVGNDMLVAVRSRRAVLGVDRDGAVERITRAGPKHWPQSVTLFGAAQDVLVADSFRDAIMRVPLDLGMKRIKVIDLPARTGAHAMWLAAAGDGHLVVSTYDPVGVYRFRPEDGEIAAPLLNVRGMVTADPASARWAFVERGALRLYDGSEERLTLSRFRGMTAKGGAVAFFPGSSLVVVVSTASGMAVRRLDEDARRLRPLFGWDGPAIRSIAIGPRMRWPRELGASRFEP
jgi:HEAT repeat protein